MVEMTPRLKTCLEAGGSVALFPILKDWPKVELRALIQDAEDFYDHRIKEIQDGWEEIALAPQVVSSKSMAKRVDTARESKFVDLIAFTSEVCAVALHFLGEAKNA